MYVRRFYYTPILGKVDELRTLLTTSVTEAKGSQRRVSLQEQVVPPAGLTFVLAEIFDDLAALETQRKGRLEPAFRQRAAQLMPLLASAPRAELFEIVASTQES